MPDDDWRPGDISTAQRAIMTFCWECLGGESPIEECAALECPLYPYRLGKPKKKALDEAARARRLGVRPKPAPQADEEEAAPAGLFESQPKNTLFD